MARPRIVIVGAGFAGFTAARRLLKLNRDAEIVVINPTDYFLYLPLLPEVAAGILEPRRVTVSLAAGLRGATVILGQVDGFDLDARKVTYRDPDGARHAVGYHRLIIAAGSVNKLLPIPGVTEYAHGFRGIPEALYLRDHLTRQIEMAASTDDPAERRARTTFLVVGAGYTGTEVAAQGVLFTKALARRYPQLAGMPRWLLADTAERVLPSLDARLARAADHVLRDRGVELLLKTSVKEATPEGVHLSDGEFLPTKSLIWCVGVRPGSADHQPRPQDRAGPAGHRRVPQRARPPGRLRDRRRGRRPRPHHARRDHRHDGGSTPPGRARPRRTMWRLRTGRGRKSRTSTTISASSSTSAVCSRRPTRWAFPCRVSRPRWSLRGYHLLSLPAIASESPRTGCSTPFSHVRASNSDWSGATPCPWRARHRKTRTERERLVSIRR